MIITKQCLPRRTFLRGLGTSLALPLLDSMVPAFGATTKSGKAPVRLAFVYHPTGAIMDRWTPKVDGAGFEFGPTLKALEPFRERLLVLSGLAQVNGRALGDGPGDHAREGATWLTGVHPKKTEGAGIRCGVSADQIAAMELRKHTQLASLELGLESPSLAGGCDSGYSCAYTNTVSWRNETTPLPVEFNPRAVFERLFGEGDSTDPAARRKGLEEQRSILDYVAGSIDRLETKLGARDRTKLTQYLEAIRDIERRIQKAEQQNASLQLPALERPSSVPDAFDDHARLMMDLQVVAFQTDMTRVITFMLGRAGSNRSYPNIGVSDGHHSITHHQNDPVKVDNVAKIDAHLVQTFAYLLEKLKSTPDGDGSLLDHSLILYGSSLADANRHTHHDLPIVLAGGAAGQVKGGRHLRFPQETPLNNLLLNMLDRAGVPSDKFGDSTGKLTYLSDV
jgi:ribosomal protein S30